MQTEFEVTLPIGYEDESGQTHREAVLRKMRGYDEDLIYDSHFSAAELVSALLHNCLVSLGGTRPIPASSIGKLYSADRNYLLVELRRITLGDQMIVNYQCPSCGSNISDVEDLGELNVRWLGDNEAVADIHVVLEDGYCDREGVLHSELVLTLPRGSDEEFVAPMASKDPLKARDAILLRCIKQFGTLSRPVLDAYGVKILRELTLGDRSMIHEALNNNAPGVNFQRRKHCTQCGTFFDRVMDVTNFFVSG